jgi:mycothiol synthase
MTTEPMTKVAEIELVFRAWRDSGETTAMADLANATNRFEGVDEYVDPDGLVNWFGHDDEHFVAARDLVLVEHQGQLVAYGWTNWVDTTDGLREHRVGAYVHPDWQRRGIGTRLLHRLEGMARAALEANPTDLPLILGSWADERKVAKRALLEREGYRKARWFHEMRRDLTAPIEIPSMPDGLDVRPIGTDRAALRRLFDADVEAFRDHWGGFASNDARFEEWLGEPDFDPSLFVVGWDGDQIAGASVNMIFSKDNAAYERKHGWLESVFVRRPWRRRGLAGALVTRSLVVLRDSGMEEARLGVDSENPTGALGVYERAGFEVAKQSIAYRKPMEVEQ